jgi:hypothetical protein
MYKFELNADLEQVWLRLAGNFKADVAQVEERLLRTQEVGASSASIGSMFEEDDRESE